MKGLFLLSCLWLAAGLASEEDSKKSCFRVEEINNWKALDDKRLVVWSPSQSHSYLVTLLNRCPGLTFEQSLVFKSTLSRTCSNSKDTIFIRDMPCHIKDIQEIDDETVQNLINEIKKAKE